MKESGVVHVKHRSYPWYEPEWWGSESIILINLKQIVGASSKCKDIRAYNFTLAITPPMTANPGLTPRTCRFWLPDGTEEKRHFNFRFRPVLNSNTEDIMLPNIFRQIGLFPGVDVQVTSGPPKQARSESIIVSNPVNSSNLIAASKKFSNPQTYRFTMGIRVSFDNGSTWTDATVPTLPEWGDMVGIGSNDATSGMTDPAVAFDHFGNAFIVGEPIKYQPNGNIDTIGMFVYKSTDGGLNWSAPTPLHVGDVNDDKSWIACDNNPSSPYYGRVYIAWGAATPLRFARSLDHGAHWKGVSNDSPGTPLVNATYGPEISVGLDGTVHIVWHPDGSNTIEYIRSTDGGET